ncbi:MAG: FHA domain-containing protein [Gammaproteobacteria bacterium]|nr:FHA domain-containing protein [Gammaproteobacteria bacterium]
MANENNNINELVADDDDPTAELELPSFRNSGANDVDLESDAKTYDADDDTRLLPTSGLTVSELQSDLKSRAETIGQLQFDIEQLRSKWLGLESEIKARETQTETLNKDLAAAHKVLGRKVKLIKKRDNRISALKAEIRQRDEEFRSLSAIHSELQGLSEQLQEPRPANGDKVAATTSKTVNELQQQLDRSEEYADSLRRKLQDVIETHQRVESERDNLSAALHTANDKIEALDDALASTTERSADLQQQLDTVDEQHQEQIRILRFELGEAQDTAVESEAMNNQLASDLVDAHGCKDELERMLHETEEHSNAELDRMRKELGKMKRDAQAYEQKLTTKSEAITVLLSELAKKSEQIDSIGEIEDVIHEIDERISERSADIEENSRRTASERVSKVLVGSVGDQVLRFPLFKDRLTIGRTDDNDIQLKVAYISRRHAVIQTENGETRIIDWGSKNGIYVNSEKVSEHPLHHGDVITVGNARFRYEERRKRDT